MEARLKIIRERPPAAALRAGAALPLKRGRIIHAFDEVILPLLRGRPRAAQREPDRAKPQ
jgi:hypothetical protein